MQMTSKRKYPTLSVFITILSWVGRLKIAGGVIAIFAGIITKSKPMLGPPSSPNWVLIWVGVGVGVAGAVLIATVELFRVFLSIEENTARTAILMAGENRSTTEGPLTKVEERQSPRRTRQRRREQTEGPLTKVKERACRDCGKIIPNGVYMCAHCGTWNQE